MFERLKGIFSSSASVEYPSVKEAGEEVKRTIQADRPIERISEDQFDRASFASQIAEIVANRNDPSSIVIGLYGPWGDGKTSTLAMIKERLKSDVDIITMEYNPWFYGDSTEALTRSFFASIRSKLEKSGFFSRENIGELMANYGAAIPQVGEAVQRVGEVMTTEGLTDTRDKLGAILRKHRKKVVIFIDDIDRLDRREIQTLFKLVRLSGGFDHTTYVLAFDDAVVAEALGEAYGAGDPIAGRRFLEKIVQVPLHLPPAKSEKLRELMFAACDRCLQENEIKLLDGEGSELGNGLATAFAYALKTPRQVKLFENAISFALPLLKNEARAIDQIQIEVLRVFYPAVYDALRKNPDCVLQSRRQENRERAPSPIELAVDSIEGSHEEKTAVRHFLRELFPRFGNTGYGNDWDASWAAEKRICSRDYFHRYFTYAVPTGDIPDLIIDSLIGRATANDAPAVLAMFDEAYQRGAAELLIRKLRSREAGISLDAVPTLVAAVAATSASMPISRDLFLSDFVVEQAATLIVRLAARAEPNKQDELLALAAENASSLLFVTYVIRHCRTDEARDGPSMPRDRVFPLTAILLRRVREIAQGRNVIDAVGNSLGRIIYTVRATGSNESVKDLNDFLSGMLAEDDANAVRLIKAFAGQRQGSDGITHAGDITYDNYRSIAEFLDADQLYRSLLAQFGDEIAEAGWHDADEKADDEDRRIANQFAHLHLHPKQADEESANE